MGQAEGTLGKQLEDRYFLQKVKLGQGSFGTVWRAVDRQTGNTVAIKQLDKASLPRRGVTRQDIERETSMMKAVVHENITLLYDSFEDGTSIYLALEYCDGGDFGDKVRERGMGIQETEVAEWMRQTCAAICALHVKGVCHRDIKPDNFMVSNNTMLKLSDFGLAIYLPKGKMLQEKCGTPAFMAPEQHHLPKRSSGYSFPADMWAAGVSMYMVMFGGKHPFLNDRGHLDDSLLLSGELDFRDSSTYKGFFGLGGFGGMGLRFSEEARSFCKRMVEPDTQRRISAEDSISVPWLKIGMKEKDLGRSPSPAERVGPIDRAGPHGRPEGPSGELSEAASEHRRSTTPVGRRSSEASRAPREADRLAEAADRRQPLIERARTPPVIEGPRTGFSALPMPAPKPRDDMALQEAAKLKTENAVLLKELEERKKKEEDLLQAQKQLQEQQRRVQNQRTKEQMFLHDKLQAQEKELQQVQQEKQELERQKTKPLNGMPRATFGVAEDTAAGGRGHATSSKAGASSRSPLLSRGVKCRYESGTYGWMNAVVQSYNESDGTYNLDVRQHAALDKISPTAEVRATDAWPPGTLAAYHSSSVNQWLAAVVVSFNESDSTYNLDVRDHADIDRIRARTTDRPGDVAAGHSDSRSTQRRGSDASTTQMGTEAGASAKPSREGRGGGSPSPGPRKDSRAKTAEATCMDRVGGGADPRRVGAGDYCIIQEYGLVVISEVRDGKYTVKMKNDRRQPARIEDMRAPDEAKYAWPAGTKVSYQSNSLGGRWIDASVASFNATNGTYNLDVRQEAAPDKVRPR